jgi:type I restriction-modification system DNA methylase subunit
MEQVIGQIRDYLRKEGITGMDSINHCIVFVIARLLNKDMCNKFGIDEKYTYKNMMLDDDGEDIGDQDLYDKIFKKNNENCLVYQIVNKMGYKNIKFRMESIVFIRQIMKKIGQLNIENLSLKYDIIGTIYELHLKSGTSNAMRDLGQYYTNRQVINYMIKICDPKMNKKGQIETILDPTMGTGGFLTMSVKYLNEKYNKKVDWSKNKNNLIGFDIDDNVKNMAVLNVLLETGELCNQTLVKNDTLYNDLRLSSDKIIEKVDIILANEPMGLSGILYKNCCGKIKELKMGGTKAEPLFMQLFMQSLTDGGRCAVIVPDGMLFNDSKLHSETRKYLIENFNLKKVVSLNDDFFLNTGVKTSILFFVKDDNNTSEVDFCSIKLNKGELEEKSIIKVSYDDIKLNNYSLFVNKYNIQETTKIEGIEYKKLDEICEIDTYKKHDTSYGKNIGKYKFHTGGASTELFCDDYDINELCIIQNRTNGSGKCNLTIDKNFSCAKQTIVYRAKNDDNNITTKFLYHYLTSHLDILENGYKGSNHKNISKDYIENIEIPIPSIEVQQMIVKQLDLLNDNNTLCKKQIEESKQILKDYVKCMTLWDDEKKLGDICEFKIGGTPRRDNNIYWENGTNIWISVSELNNNIIYDSKEKITNEGVKNSNVKLIKKDSILMSFKMSVGKKAIAGVDLYTNEAIIGIECNNLMLNKYLYNVIDTFDFSEACSSIGGGNLNKQKIENLKIKVPSLEKQKEIVAYCDEIEETIKLLKKRITSNEQLMKQILDTYLKVKEQVIEEVTEVKKEESDEQLDEQLEEIEEEKPKKKVVVKKTIKKKSTL